MDRRDSRISRGVVTLSARCARAHPVFGPDKDKDLCGHTQFLLRNVPEPMWAHPVFIAKCARESGAHPVSKT